MQIDQRDNAQIEPLRRNQKATSGYQFSVSGSGLSPKTYGRCCKMNVPAQCKCISFPLANHTFPETTG
jgi:hypothetical protein